jgi:hypothetical protein
VFDVRELVGRIAGVDLDAADLERVRAMISDLSRLDAWSAAKRIAAKRRLDDLAREAENRRVVIPERDLRLSANASKRATEQVGNRQNALDALPELADALENGDTTPEHVDALHRGLAPLSPEDRRTMLAQAGAQLAQRATETSPEQFAKEVKVAAALAITDGGLENFAKQRRQNSLKWWYDRITGMLQLHGQLDPESGAKLVGRLTNIVEELFHDTAPDTCPDDPLQKQDHLRALALISLVDDPIRAGGRPDLITVIGLDQLRTDLDHAGVVDLASGGQVPVETLRRLACDANIIPAVLDSNGVLLDMGSRVRLATNAQRLALRAMYDSCALDDCTVPFDRCQIHHINPWHTGGTTNLDELLPLCNRDHHHAHEGRWKLHLDPITRVLTITYPDGTTSTHHPPRAKPDAA